MCQGCTAAVPYPAYNISNLYYVMFIRCALSVLRCMGLPQALLNFILVYMVPSLVLAASDGQRSRAGRRAQQHGAAASSQRQALEATTSHGGAQLSTAIATAASLDATCSSDSKSMSRLTSLSLSDRAGLGLGLGSDQDLVPQLSPLYAASSCGPSSLDAHGLASDGAASEEAKGEPKEVQVTGLPGVLDDGHGTAIPPAVHLEQTSAQHVLALQVKPNTHTCPQPESAVITPAVSQHESQEADVPEHPEPAAKAKGTCESTTITAYPQDSTSSPQPDDLLRTALEKVTALEHQAPHKGVMPGVLQRPGASKGALLLGQPPISLSYKPRTSSACISIKVNSVLCGATWSMLYTICLVFALAAVATGDVSIHFHTCVVNH